MRSTTGFAWLAIYSLVFLFVLKLWSASAPIRQLTPIPDADRGPRLTAWGVATGIFLLGLAALQYSQLGLTLISGPDEPYLVMSSLAQWGALKRSLDGGLAVAAVFGPGLLMVIGGWIFFARTDRRWKTVVAGGALVLLGLALQLWAAPGVSPQWGDSQRWPPLGTLFEVTSFSVFGANAAASRMPAMLCYLFTGIALYRLLADASSRFAGFVAVVVALTAPTMLTQGQLMTRETAGALFMTLAASRLIRWWRHGQPGDFSLAVVLTAAGYLVRRPAIVFAGVLLVVVAAALWRRRGVDLRHNAAFEIGGVATLVLAILPWAWVARDIRPFELSPGNWLQPLVVGAYAARFPTALGLTITVLGAAGILIGLLRPRALTSVAMLWLGAVYVLFTSDTPRWIPTIRFVVLMGPPLAVLAAEAVRTLTGQFAQRARVAAAALVLVSSLFLLRAWVWCAGQPWPAVSPCRAEIPRYPFDQVVAWLDEEGDGEVLLSPATYWQTALGPTSIFSAARRPVGEILPPYSSRSSPLTAERCLAACTEAGVDYVVVPVSVTGGGPRAVFMGDGEIARMADVGLARTATFANGRHRLDLYSCPQP